MKSLLTILTAIPVVLSVALPQQSSPDCDNYCVGNWVLCRESFGPQYKPEPNSTQLTLQAEVLANSRPRHSTWCIPSPSPILFILFVQVLTLFIYGSESAALSDEYLSQDFGCQFLPCEE
ncbi:hypothetical protein P154DRAFT_571822 [Amniculicola lignicola CBS 123094]|uniref:CBM1 domain-containing protein n=1 Tax=Amniculicola lignicola CBS 123094 TaxID=1392246 RepID=A0A6A5WRW4_9PLEO|nr:hypothetical protein P154DRAFT_571822 [Amniculicola lignicola CBS 123094]